MIQSRNGQSDGATAVVFRTGKGWRVVIGRPEGSQVRVGAWREFDAIEAKRIDHFFDEHEVEQVIGVLPASAVICRVCTLPDGEPRQVEQALSLQAEAHLAELTPSHRQAAGALQAAPDESRRVGLLLAWPEIAPFELPQTTRPTTYTADIAAIAAIVNGFRPSEPVLWLDRAAGSIAIALTQTEGMAFRAAHEPADSPSQWQESVAHVLAETAINAGYSASFTESLSESIRQRMAGSAQHDAILLASAELLDETKSRVAGAPSESQWWADYGIGVGTLLAASDELVPLTQMLASRPEEKPPLLERVTTVLSDPKRALAAVVICAIVIALWPLASAGLRNLATWARLPDVGQYREAKRQAEEQLHMYDALQKEAWPMSKLLSDIACCTPNTITIDQISLSQGSSFRLIGMARADADRSGPEVIALMKQQLEKTRIFTKVFHSWSESDTPGFYEFTIDGLIPFPYRGYSYPIEQDYQKWTLSDRLYNQGGPPVTDEGQDDPTATVAVTNDDTSSSPTEASEVAVDNPPNTSDPQDGDVTVAAATGESGRNPEEVIVRRPGGNQRPGGRSGAFPGGDADKRSDNRGGGGLVTPPSANIPEPVTQTEVDAMSEPEVRAAIGRVSDARRLGRLTPEQEQQLQTQWRMLWAKLRSF